MSSILQQHLDKILLILREFGITKAGVFGSFARGEDDEKSDLDLLIEAPPTHSLLKIIALRNKISRVINRPVDLVEYHLLKPYIRKRALKEEVRIL